MQQAKQETLPQQSYLDEQPGLHHELSDGKHKHKNTIHGMGIAEVVMGSVSVLLSIIVLSIARNEAYNFKRSHGLDYLPYYESNYIAEGIWGGIFIIVTGVLGIFVKRKPTKGLYIVNMVMAIITANVSGVVVVISSINAIVVNSSVLLVLHAMISIICFAVFILTIIHAAFCCGGICCKSHSDDTYHLLHDPQHTEVGTQQPQYVRGPNGQLLMIVEQPVTNGEPSAHQNTYPLQSGQ